MRQDLVESAEAARQAEAAYPAKLGQAARPDTADGPQPQAAGRGMSGVAGVVSCQEADRPRRATPWQVRSRNSPAPGGYVARVASPAEGAAIAEAWQHVVGQVGVRAEVKAMRKTVKRMAADLRDGQACLPLGDGLEGWLRKPNRPEGDGDGQ